MTPTQTGDKPMVTPDAQDRKREALIVRLGAFADLLCQEPLPGASGDVAYDLLRQAAAQIASDRQHIARHREQETREQPLDTIQRLGQEFDGEQPRLGREAVRDAIHDAIVSAYRQGALDVHNEWIKLDLDDGLSDDPDFTEAAHDHAASEMPGLGAVIAALTFEPDVVFCERCQGNGELVTDWDRYMKGDMDASGEEYVEPCPDCEGEGHRTRPASPEASPSLGMGEAHGDRKCDACHRANPVWFAPSPLWNLVIGGPEATDDPGGVLCPICFIEKAEAAGIMPATGAWLVTKEPAASLTSPSPDLAEENERLRDDVAIWKGEAADRSQGMVELNLDRAAMGVENMQLREALAPFAAVLDDYDPADEDDATPGTVVVGSVTDYSLTLGDFRLARSTLQSISTANGGPGRDGVS